MKISFETSNFPNGVGVTTLPSANDAVEILKLFSRVDEALGEAAKQVETIEVHIENPGTWEKWTAVIMATVRKLDSPETTQVELLLDKFLLDSLSDRSIDEWQSFGQIKRVLGIYHCPRQSIGMFRPFSLSTGQIVGR